MAKLNLESKTLITFSGQAKGEFITAKIKRLISTEEDNKISFWVDGDRPKAYFLETFDLSLATPIFAKIDNTGPKLSDWVACVVTINGISPIPDNPYKNNFDSLIVENLQNQGFDVIMHYYAVEFKKELVVKKVSKFSDEPSKQNLKDFVYTGGHWGYSTFYPPASEFTNLTISYYNVEDTDPALDRSFQEITLPIDDGPSNESYLNGPNSPYFLRITRVPWAKVMGLTGVSRATSELRKSLNNVILEDGEKESDLNDDEEEQLDDVIEDTIINRYFLKSEDQNYHSSLIYSTPKIKQKLSSFGSEDSFILGEISRHILY